MSKPSSVQVPFTPEELGQITAGCMILASRPDMGSVETRRTYDALATKILTTMADALKAAGHKHTPDEDRCVICGEPLTEDDKIREETLDL